METSEPSTETAGQMAQELDESGMGPTALASIGSVALAPYYYVRGDRQRGQFVGLWPATVLGLAVSLELENVSRSLEGSD